VRGEAEKRKEGGLQISRVGQFRMRIYTPYIYKVFIRRIYAPSILAGWPYPYPYTYIYVLGGCIYTEVYTYIYGYFRIYTGISTVLRMGERPFEVTFRSDLRLGCK
jgi:hypothetical protein